MEPAIHASGLAPAPFPLPPLVAPTPFVVLKTPVTVAVPRGFGRRPAEAGPRRRGVQAGSPPRGEALRGDAPSSRHLALGPRNLALYPRVTLSAWVGRAQEEPAGSAPPSAPGTGVGGPARRPRPLRVPGTTSSRGGGGTLGAAHLLRPGARR